jgi:hypothetical protein
MWVQAQAVRILKFKYIHKRTFSLVADSHINNFAYVCRYVLKAVVVEILLVIAFARKT